MCTDKHFVSNIQLIILLFSVKEKKVLEQINNQFKKYYDKKSSNVKRILQNYSSAVDQPAKLVTPVHVNSPVLNS